MSLVIFSFYLLVLVIMAGYSVFIVIHIFSWLTLPKLKISNKQFTSRVSVIIPARNEEVNIIKCLNCLSGQDYPAKLFDVVVVDDYSKDRTKENVIGFISESSINIRYIPSTEQNSNKKKAITAGIFNSTGDIIAVTDADCTMGKSWLSSLVMEFEKDDAVMVCGPLLLNPGKHFIEKFQTLEMSGLSLLSGAGIRLGIPLLCNGANLAYSRAAFEAVEGYKGIDRNPSGDDTMLMIKMNKIFPGRIRYVKSEEAIVCSGAAITLKDFLQQRIRWASKGFQSGSKFNSIISTLVFLSNLLPLITFIIALFVSGFIFAALQSILIKFITDFLLLLVSLKFFRKSGLIAIFPVAEIFTLLYTVWVGIAANFISFEWKGREFRGRKVINNEK